MAVLVKTEILQLIEEGKLAFNPELDRWQVQPHSVDLRLGFTFLVPKQAQMTIKGREAIRVDHLQIKAGNSRYFEVIELEEGQYFELLPREHVTVVSLEKIKLSAGLMAVLYPRSSVNRRGLTVDLSGIVDAGYEGAAGGADGQQYRPGDPGVSGRAVLPVGVPAVGAGGGGVEEPVARSGCGPGVGERAI